MNKLLTRARLLNALRDDEYRTALRAVDETLKHLRELDFRRKEQIHKEWNKVFNEREPRVVKARVL